MVYYPYRVNDLERKNRKGRTYNWRLFEEAREYVRSLGMKSAREWQTWASSRRRPVDIPFNPSKAYKDIGWISFGDWLGTEDVSRHRIDWQPFEEARKFVRSLGLKNCNEWRAWTKSSARPTDIPTEPRSVYEKEGWKGFGDWLGTDRIACRNRVYRPFRKARAYARNLGLKSIAEWEAWTKGPERPEDIPMHADRTYEGHGWKGWGDWLGTGRIVTNSYGHRPFEEALAFARSLGLKNSLEWLEFCKSGSKPKDIPYQPFIIYKGRGWISYRDWLGTGKPGKIRKN